MLDAYLYDGLRSPFGRHAGALSSVRPDDLIAEVMRALLERSSWAPANIEDVLIGCTNQAGEDARNIGRHAALLAGCPTTIPGQTVNRLCASGLAAAIDAARAVTCGEGQLYVAGGVESMSRAPFVLSKGETAYSRDVRMFDSTIGARFPNPRLTERYGSDTMPETGDNVAKEFGVSREDADRFAAASQAKYERARLASIFGEEIQPITLASNRGSKPLVVAEDEHPRPATDTTSLARLKPLSTGGIVTAGNASGINDGAVALLIGSRNAGDHAAKQPLVRLLASAAVGVEPRIMGIGPARAIPKALERAGLGLKDMDIIEINEAFASQVLACLKLLDVSADDPRINPNGGAIAIGHPLGASGARLLLTAARELQRRKGRYAVVSLCIGVGQGLALIIERT